MPNAPSSANANAAAAQPVAKRTRSRAGTPSLALELGAPLLAGGHARGQNADVVAAASVRAPPVVASDAARTPVALTMVLDVSGSMGGEKLELVAKTVRFVVSQLTSADVLGIVAYDTSVYESLPLTRMDEEGKNRARVAANSLHAGSLTNLSGGLLAGLRQQRGLPTIVDDDDGDAGPAANVAMRPVGLAMANVAFDGTPRKRLVPKKRKAPPSEAPKPSEPVAVPPNAVRAVHLFTDGHANVGETDAGKIVAEASKLVNGPHAPVAVSTFGYGMDHNEGMLQNLALGGGDYHFVQNEAAIPRAFGEALGGLLTTIASHVVLEVSAENAQVEGPLDKSLKLTRINASLLRIVLDDLSAEERRDVPVLLKLPKGGADASLSASVTYQDAAGLERTVHATPVVLRRVDDESGNVPNLAVVAHALRLEVAAAMDDAEAALRAGNGKKGCDVLDAVQRKLVGSAAAHLPDVQALLSSVAALKRHAQVDVRSAPKALAMGKGSCRRQKGGAAYATTTMAHFSDLAAANAGRNA